MAKNTKEAVDKIAEIAADAPLDAAIIPESQKAPKGGKQIVRMLSGIEIHGVKIPAGRAAALNKYLAISLVADGVADDDQAAIDYALSENPWIIDPFNNN